MDGIINTLKPAGISSFGFLKRVKYKLGLKKVGHLGTLDPDAVGVLVLLCGRATKLAEALHGGTKIYRSVFTFGVETDTLDAMGQVTASSDVIPTREQVLDTLKTLVGDVEIEVPKFSAVHINGRRAYDLAREGIEFTAPKKTVHIDRFELLDDTKYLELHRTELLKSNEFFFEIECQVGTYIRSLAKLLAKLNGTYAIASTIIRTRVGDFKIDDAKGLDEISLVDLIRVNSI